MSRDPLANMRPEIRAQMRETFLDEAAGLVDQLEKALLALEQAPDDAETINDAFRAAHTIKGSAAGVGLGEISTFTHELEYALEGVRSRRCPLRLGGITLLLHGVDHLRGQLRAAHLGQPIDAADAKYAQNLAAEFPRAGPNGDEHKHLSQGADSGENVGPAADRDRPASTTPNVWSPEALDLIRAEIQAGATLWRVRWQLPEDAFTLGLDPLSLLNVLADEAVIVSATPQLASLPPLEALDPTRCYLGFDAAVAAHGSQEALRAVFEFCPDNAQVEVQALELAPADRAALGLPERASRPAPAPAAQTPAPGAAGPATPQALPRPAAQSEGQTLEAQTIRVKQTRLDSFMNQVGELVTARNALLHLQRRVEEEYDLPDLARQLKATTSAVSRTVSQLQADVLNLRMVPVRSISQRLVRVAHDVAARQAKQINLELRGEDTEVDKTVADALIDPLLHLVRNAVDHGIELPEARRTAGKDPTGQISIGAGREGNSVVIEVRDDGAGMDPRRLREAAVRKGLLDAAAAERLSDTESLQLVFMAGLSTAHEVSEISGRGVGMDVVRSNVARMGGSVGVQSQVGQGASIRLQLPLSLSLFRGLVMRAGGETFAVPLEAVRETTALLATARKSLYGRPVASVRGQLIGLVALDEVMGLAPAAGRNGKSHSEPARVDEAQTVVVVESGSELVGLIVDAIDSPQEIMVKPLESYLSVDGAVAGACIMGDGRVAMVLDPAGVVRFALARAQRKVSG